MKKIEFLFDPMFAADGFHEIGADGFVNRKLETLHFDSYQLAAEFVRKNNISRDDIVSMNESIHIYGSGQNLSSRLIWSLTYVTNEKIGD